MYHVGYMFVLPPHDSFLGLLLLVCLEKIALTPTPHPTFSSLCFFFPPLLLYIFTFPRSCLPSTTQTFSALCCWSPFQLLPDHCLWPSTLCLTSWGFLCFVPFTSWPTPSSLLLLSYVLHPSSLVCSCLTRGRYHMNQLYMFPCRDDITGKSERLLDCSGDPR